MALTAMTMFTFLAVSFGLGLKTRCRSGPLLAAVSTIVSEKKSVWSASVVGGLWGHGHTISLLVADILVIWMHLQISEQVAQILEFCVALMLIGLAIDTLLKVIRGGQLHWHPQSWRRYARPPHAHEAEDAHARELTSGATHHDLKLSPRQLIFGMIHGMAGSGALCF